MSYLIYLRKSRKDVELEQYGDEETLARHERILLDLAKTNGYEIGAIYREVVSGETISARPEMQRLISEVEQGLWDGVLVMEVERLARGDTIDQGIVARAFKLSSTKIVTPVKTYDPDNEYDEEYFEFGLFMSRREYKTINRRIQRGRVSAAKEGKYVSSTPPYGYDRVKLKDKGYSLAANGESDVVKSILLGICKATVVRLSLVAWTICTCQQGAVGRGLRLLYVISSAIPSMPEKSVLDIGK